MYFHFSSFNFIYELKIGRLYAYFIVKNVELAILNLDASICMHLFENYRAQSQTHVSCILFNFLIVGEVIPLIINVEIEFLVEMGHLAPKELIFSISSIFGPGASPREAQSSQILENS